MVGDRLDPPGGQSLGDLLDLFPRRAIDDPRLVHRDDLADAIVLLLLLFHRRDPQRKVRPGEAADHLEGFAQLQHIENVRADHGSRRRRQCHALRPADLVERLAESHVVRPEIVAPLAQAVRLVDREKRDLHALQCAEKRLRTEALRRDIDQLVAPRPHPVQALLLVFPRHRRVDQRRRDALRKQRVHLVLHQRDQRRDDQRHTLKTKCRQLIAQRLPAAGRHHHQPVAATGNLLDHPVLSVEKSAVSEVLLERFERGLGQDFRRGGRHELVQMNGGSPSGQAGVQCRGITRSPSPPDKWESRGRK